MGQSKYNPTAQAAKAGELPPKPRKLSKRERERHVAKIIRERTGITRIFEGGPYG